MKLAILATVGIVAVTSAQDSIGQLVSQLPSCALPCFVKNVPTVCDSVTDYSCQCEPANMMQLRKLITPCVVGACTQSEDLQVLGISNKICSAVSAGAAGSGSGSSSSAATSAATMSAPMSSAASSSAPAASGATGGAGASSSAAPMAPSSPTVQPSQGLATGYTAAAAPLATAAPMVGAGLAAAVAAFL